eukprot:TRINITY_DN7124_c0_g1_i2.p1 TRINITY_DN7124_c0_g1~~TRINITY_DN7124_c0_g1_i2.p1  ORF type:complete len:182 (-),score=48.95 TRINITY_DN7124_c0_g1_i2:656-1120(-)
MTTPTKATRWQNYLENRPQKLTKMREYFLQNKKKLSEYMKQYRSKFREEINLKRRKSFLLQGGGIQRKRRRLTDVEMNIPVLTPNPVLCVNSADAVSIYRKKQSLYFRQYYERCKEQIKHSTKTNLVGRKKQKLQWLSESVEHIKVFFFSTSTL